VTVSFSRWTLLHRVSYGQNYSVRYPVAFNYSCPGTALVGWQSFVLLCVSKQENLNLTFMLRPIPVGAI